MMETNSQSKTVFSHVHIRLLILGVGILASGVLAVEGGTSLYSAVSGRPAQAPVQAAAADFKLARELESLPLRPLKKLEENWERLMLIQRTEAINVAVSEISGKGKKNKDSAAQQSQASRPGADRSHDDLGVYKDVSIKVSGDIFEQMFALGQITRALPDAILLKEIKGNSKGMEILGRVYGRALPVPQEGKGL
jgi:hypothetical protein